MVIQIIGLGLIGGSMAIDLKKRGFADTVIGTDKDNLHAQTALNIGIADEIADLEAGIKRADLIILAAPADAGKKLLPYILNRAEKQTVTDVCSVKEDICASVENHPKRSLFVAAHPMAGTEYSGPRAAVSGLFDGKANIICNPEESSETALRNVQKMYECLNMRSIFLDAKSHDIHAAYVSHISHISSFALALTVLEKEKDEKRIFDLAGGGFRSTVRLAKSSAEMWTPIFDNNSDNVSEILETYISVLEDFKNTIKQKNRDKLNKMIHSANKIKRVI